jgi:hypothetical protein
VDYAMLGCPFALGLDSEVLLLQLIAQPDIAAKILNGKSS